MTHGDIPATAARLLALDDRAFSDVVVAESRGRAGDDVVQALRADWEVCNRWVETLVAKDIDARDRMTRMQRGSKSWEDTKFFRSKITKRIRVAKGARALLERSALLSIIEEMDCLLFDAVGEGWVESLSDDTFEHFERFVP